MTRRTTITALFLVATAAALFLAGGSSRNGCLWDSDTLRTEATGAPGMVETIVGRFDRYPPLYYEMRLERVAKELEADPTDHLDNLAAYDDAGVACDRLGMGDEAIEWMTKKRAALDALPESEARTNHEYRYLANLGTFHAHRWIKNGADRSDLTDIQRARDLIDQAITLNPDAHFGRERYQLMALDWILQPPVIDPSSSAPSNILEADPALAGRGSGLILGELEGTAHADAGEGFAGLIALGNAWNSFDVFFSLGDALQGGGDSSLAALAWYRAEEIALDGGHSLHPNYNASGFRADSFTARHLSDPAPVEAFYQEARAEADAWHTARTAYITTRLEQGEHPDTHPDFFAAWVEPSSMPTMPNGFLGLQGSALTLVVGLAILLALPAIFVAMAVAFTLWLLRRRKRRRARRAAAPTPGIAPA